MPLRSVLSLFLVALALLATCATPAHADTTITLAYSNADPFVMPLTINVYDADLIATSGDEMTGTITIRPTAQCWLVTATDQIGQGAAWWDDEHYGLEGDIPRCAAFSVYTPLVVR